MAVQKIHKFHALKPGSQVWFVPEKSVSRWTQQLDWYLNFQICQFQNKKTQTSLQEIKKIMIEEEIRFDLELQHPKHLMIAAEHYLPTHAVIVLQKGSVEEHISEIQNYIQNLSLESARIFLPQNTTAQEFVKKWASKSIDAKISLVEDA